MPGEGRDPGEGRLATGCGPPVCDMKKDCSSQFVHLLNNMCQVLSVSSSDPGTGDTAKHLTGSRQTFSLKGDIVNALGVRGHVAPVTTTQLCLCDGKAASTILLTELGGDLLGLRALLADPLP